MMTSMDRRPRVWPILFASLIGVAALAATGKADVLVSSLEGDSAISWPAAKGFSPASPVQEDLSSSSAHDSHFNRLALMTTIMFFNPNSPGNGSGGTGGGGGGGGTGDGGGTTPTGSEAPEPATLLTGLVGSGLLGMYTWVKRRRIA